MIKCCIFDLDGTILNTLETIRYYVNRTMIKYGRAPITEEECRLFVGAGARVLLTKAFNSRGGIDEKEFLEMYQFTSLSKLIITSTINSSLFNHQYFFKEIT